MVRFGVRWDFLPNRELLQLNSLKAAGFGFISLRLETLLKYGGPISDFLKACEAETELRCFSDYLPVAAIRSWDSVHHIAAKDFLVKHKVFLLTCRSALPEVPQPTTVVRELLDNLPAGVPVCISVRSEKDLARLEGLNGIYLSLNLAEWRRGEASFSHFAAQIREIEIEMSEAVTVDSIVEAIGEVRQAQAPDSELGVCFSLRVGPEFEMRDFDLVSAAISKASQELK